MADIIDKQLADSLASGGKILREQDIKVVTVHQNDTAIEKFSAELEFWSPLGEVFCFNIEFGDGVMFAEAFEEFANNFNPDKHAAMWIENRDTVSGVPQSVRDLIDDAEAIKEILCETANKLSEAEKKSASKSRRIERE